MYKALFFDLDETLVDAMDCHMEASEKAFESLGISFKEVEKRTAHHDFLGTRLIDILKTQRDAMGISEQELPLKKLAKMRESYFLELIEKNAKLLPGAKAAIMKAKKQKKIVAITSSGTRSYINLCIKKFGFTPYIDFIVGEEDTPKGKPFPDVYEKAFSLLPAPLAIKKTECLVIEDSPNGVAAAKAAKLPVCYIPLYPTNKTIAAALTFPNLIEFNID